MAYSYSIKVGDGSSRVFSFDFDYLDVSHIHVEVDGVPTPHTLNSPYVVQIEAAPANGVPVKIYRETPLDTRAVDFTNGSILQEADLDTSALQIFFIAQESADRLETALQLTDDVYNSANKRITNLANPVDGYDAVNRNYLEAAITGVSGIKGDKGDQGEIGSEGPQGIQGIQGPQGLKGDTGDHGPQGPVGSKGAKGDKGDKGAQGVQGSQGIQGPKGDKGDIGSTGAEGPEGPQGQDGIQGPQGIQGVQGVAGADGQSFTVDQSGVFADRSVYDNEAAGFSFLSTDNSMLYVRLTAVAGTWSGGVPFGKGAKGDQGPQGQQGIQGIQGEQGPQGIQGIKGDAGLDGAKGDKGDKGDQGIQGIQGIQGVAGADGADGMEWRGGWSNVTAYVVGDAVGLNGQSYVCLADHTNQDPEATLGIYWDLMVAKGRDGQNGAKGDQGDQGIQGIQGIQGPKGDKGDAGGQGIQGPKGDKGDQGDKGEDGIGNIVPASWMKRSSTSTQSITNVPTAIPFDVVDTDASRVDVNFTNSKFQTGEDGSYRIGFAITTKAPSDQRAQVSFELYIDGVGEGQQRTSSYIRNSGTAYDYWVHEMAGEPFELVAGQTVEIYVYQVSGGTYGPSGGLTGISVVGDKSRAWFERMTGDQGPQGDPASVTKAAVEAVLTGQIDTHTHAVVPDKVVYENISYLHLLRNIDKNVGFDGIPNGFVDNLKNTTGLTVFTGSHSSGQISFAPFTVDLGTTVVPDMSNNTTPAGWVASSSRGGGDAYEGFTRSTAQPNIDSSSPAWLQIQCPSTQNIGGYTIEGADSVARSPRSWKFQGSNNGSTWITLDQQTSVPAWTSREARTYTLASNHEYTYFRLYITANHGDSLYYITELEIHPATVTSDTFSCETITVGAVAAPKWMTVQSVITTAGPVEMKVSTDGGTTFSPVDSITKEVDNGGTADLYVGRLELPSNTGTDVRVKVSVSTNVPTIYHDHSVNWGS